MKQLFTLLLLLASFNLVQAQLASGSIAPDFTATDINGNTWNLYDLLDEGKTVILDVSATWCGPCWTYVQGGALETIYEEYGPDGTDEIMVLFIEGDPNTGMADLMGTTAPTQGDWISAVGYPIIDDSSIADLYNISYYPTMYTVCPNRIVTEVGQLSAAAHYAFSNDCPEPAGTNNGGVIFYEGLQGSVCSGSSVTPTFTLQNMGTGPLTSASLDLLANGNVIESQEYTGDLSTFQLAPITFGSYDILEDTELTMAVTSVNGGDDDDATADSYSINLNLAETTASSVLNLNIATDNYGYETYWEIVDDNGTTYYSGGNPGAITTPPSIQLGFYANDSNYDVEIALPSDGCYEFRIYDLVGDGICCDYGTGSYTLSDADGNVLGTGGAFEEEERVPFELVGSPGIANNAQILVYDGLFGAFCGETTTSPEILVQNIGNAPITSMTVDVIVNGVVVETITYDQEIAVNSFATLVASAIEVDADAEIVLSVMQVNGEDDTYEYRNAYTAPTTRDPVAGNEEIAIDITTDDYGYELYWQITDDMGTVVASGGNENVAASGGGGNRIAAAGDPGAYANSSSISESATLPAEGCFQVQVWDDYGDGMCCQYGDGSFVITAADGTELFNAPLFGRETGAGFEYKMLVDVPVVTEVERISLAPNPADAQMWVNLELTENVQLNLSVVNALGQQVLNMGTEVYMAGEQRINLQTSQLSPGIYFLRLQEGRSITTRKFSVSH